MKKLFLLLFSVLSLCMVTSCKEPSPADEEEKTPQIVIQDGVLVAYPAALTQENIRISLPDEVKIIGPNAFKDNPYILTCEGKNVEEIKENAFENCPNLTTARFIRVRKIGQEAFKNCVNLKFFFTNVVPDIEWYTFKGCMRDEKIMLVPKVLFPKCLNWEDAGFTLQDNGQQPLDGTVVDDDNVLIEL